MNYEEEFDVTTAEGLDSLKTELDRYFDEIKVGLAKGSTVALRSTESSGMMMTPGSSTIYKLELTVR